MRAAIYARYSTELQSEASIEDQIRICRERALREGWQVTEAYHDRAISGASQMRPGLQRMLADAREGRFKVIVAEALDRLSRDQEDVAGIFKRLRFAGVAIVTLAEGEISELHVGLKGTMNALFLKDLAAKVRRGQRGRIEAGRSAGGLSYGYDTVREYDADGERVRGKRTINQDQHQVILRIFEAFTAGRSPRAIASELNREGIRSPAGKCWNASTINGSRQRRTGILWNEAYAGRLVYNRLRMDKDPETGRRISRVNPEAEWVVVDAPNLRIVPEPLWQAVQARKRAYAGVKPLQQRRPRHLLSGLLRCAACGGAYTIKSRHALGCSNHREQGTCDNGRTVLLAEVERRVLDGIKAKLLAPDVLRVALKTYNDERRRLRDTELGRRREIAKRLPGLGREIERLVDAIVDGTATKAGNARLVALEAEKERLAAELESLEGAHQIVDLHPGAIEAYGRAVQELRGALDRHALAEAMTLIRRLVERVDVVPGERRGPFGLRVHGRLAELANLPHRKQGENASTALMVAGEGFEPPTLGL